jgi:hypothetical protein
VEQKDNVETRKPFNSNKLKNMRRIIIILAMALLRCVAIDAQTVANKPEGLINASVNAEGTLEVVASQTSSHADFDFLKGEWKLNNRKLKTRLNHCTDWIAFDATVVNRALLNGMANLDVCRTISNGIAYETISFRVFNPATRLWSSYWIDGKTGIMDPVVIGSFSGDIGTFYGKNIYNSIPVLVMFRWDKTDPEKPEWSQAYSTDKGKTWEWNMMNASHRLRDSTAAVFMRGVISSDSADFNAAFSPDGSAFYFSRAINKKTGIFVSRKVNERWSAPERVSFSSANFSDADPAFSPQGELYFISNRPRNKNDTTSDYDIWKVIPAKNNRWSHPINVTELNSDQDEYYISFTKDGDVYFSSSRNGGFGEEDIYCSRYKNNKLEHPQNLGDKINTIHSEYDPFVTHDGDGLIFTSSGQSDSYGRGDLYWSVRKENNWTATRHFDENINTPTRDYCPYITPDHQYFFYSSAGDIKYMSIESLPVELTVTLK